MCLCLSTVGCILVCLQSEHVHDLVPLRSSAVRQYWDTDDRPLKAAPLCFTPNCQQQLVTEVADLLFFSPLVPDLNVQMLRFNPHPFCSAPSARLVVDGLFYEQWLRVFSKGTFWNPDQHFKTIKIKFTCRLPVFSFALEMVYTILNNTIQLMMTRWWWFMHFKGPIGELYKFKVFDLIYLDPL